jgi:hypothetical protein
MFVVAAAIDVPTGVAAISPRARQDQLSRERGLPFEPQERFLCFTLRLVWSIEACKLNLWLSWADWKSSLYTVFSRTWRTDNSCKTRSSSQCLNFYPTAHSFSHAPEAPVCSQ